MRYFLKELLEPITYLAYCFILMAAYMARKIPLYKLLSCYYAFASLMLFLANVENNAGANSDWNYNLLFLAGSLVFALYYHGLCRTAYKKKFIINTCLVNVLLFAWFDVLQGGFYSYNTYAYAFMLICVVLYSLFYYSDVLQQVSEENILHRFDFWFVSANLFYSLGAFMVVLLYNDTELSIHGDLWGIQSVVLFISSFITFNGYLALRKR